MSTLPAILPRLTSLEQELDLSPEAFGELESSGDFLDDIEALRRQLDENGYLYLPGYLHREEVLAARDEVALRLEHAGWLNPDFPREDMVMREGFKLSYYDSEITVHNPALMKVLYEGPMMEFYTRFFGAEVDTLITHGSAPSRRVLELHLIWM